MKVDNGKSKSWVLWIVLLLIGICLVVAGVYFAAGGFDNGDDISKQAGQSDVNQGEVVSDSKIKIVMSGDTKYAYLDETKKAGDVEFSNIEIKLVGRNKSEFRADVKNTADKFLESSKVRIKVLDENGEVTDTFGGILTALANFEPNEFMTVVLMDLTEASDFEIEIVEE